MLKPVSALFLSLLFVFTACSSPVQPVLDDLESTPNLETPALEAPVESEEMPVVQDQVFEDEFLSFTHSSAYKVLIKEAFEGGYAKSIEFLVWEDEAFRDLGLSLAYPYGLGASGDYYNFSEMQNHYANLSGPSPVLDVQNLNIGGRTGVWIESDGLGAPSIELLIAIESVSDYQDAEEYAYRFVRSGMSPYLDEADALLEQIMDSLTFRK